MPQTRVSIDGESFLINDRLTYSEIAGSKPEVNGLLMNARFIQGVFDDRAAPERFARWGHKTWDPAAHTERLVAALPEWYAHGLRAFTVGFQGGGPCFTIDNSTIDNNPFGEEGKALDPAYATRMDRLIRGADYVDFYCNGERVYTAYDEPFAVNYRSNWMQGPWEVRAEDKEWKAVIRLRDGNVMEKVATAQGIAIARA